MRLKSPAFRRGEPLITPHIDTCRMPRSYSPLELLLPPTVGGGSLSRHRPTPRFLIAGLGVPAQDCAMYRDTGLPNLAVDHGPLEALNVAHIGDCGMPQHREAERPRTRPELVVGSEYVCRYRYRPIPYRTVCPHPHLVVDAATLTVRVHAGTVHSLLLTRQSPANPRLAPVKLAVNLIDRRCGPA